MPRVALALGSNLGDRLKNLQAARDLLAGISTTPLLQAPVYRTAPVGCPPGSPDFYNTVVEISYDGLPAGLLATTQAFQSRLGRIAVAEKNAPRLIDIDLLYFGSEIISTPDLELPHPRLAVRRFVLQPLAAIRPGLVLPGQALSIADLLAALPDTDLEQVAAIW
jgi:2-amino-4-hydroxy-6-hydroxymethyldihydropteridine diphosphokinase